MTSPPPARTPPAAVPVHVYKVTGRPANSGIVLALFTASPADEAVATIAAELSLRVGRRVTAAAVLSLTGKTLHHARKRHISARTDTVLYPVLPLLTPARPVHTAALLLPLWTKLLPRLPATRVHRFATRTGASLIVTPTPLTHTRNHHTLTPTDPAEVAKRGEATDLTSPPMRNDQTP